MPPRKPNATGRNKGGFFTVRHDIVDSPAWLSLSPVARCVWLEVMRRYKGYNNGSIPLSCREASERIKVGKDTASRAFDELMAKGFLRIGQDSSFSMKSKSSRRWIITHDGIRGQSPTADWRDWKNETRSDHKDTQSDSKDS